MFHDCHLLDLVLAIVIVALDRTRDIEEISPRKDPPAEEEEKGRVEQNDPVRCNATHILKS